MAIRALMEREIQLKTEDLLPILVRPTRSHLRFQWPGGDGKIEIMILTSTAPLQNQHRVAREDARRFKSNPLPQPIWLSRVSLLQPLRIAALVRICGRRRRPKRLLSPRGDCSHFRSVERRTGSFGRFPISLIKS
jgi:hypothetical protein